MSRLAAVLCFIGLIGCTTVPPIGTGGPALWVVRSPSATVYLLGTVHVLSAPAPWFNPRISDAFSHSSELWLEADLSVPGALLKAMVARGFDTTYDISTHLPDATWTALRPVLLACGLSAPAVSHARPWLVVMVLGACGRRPAAHAELNESLTPDLLLTHLAVAAGKPIRSFETASQHIAVLADLPDDESLALLRMPAVQASTLASTVMPVQARDRAWLVGDLGALDRGVIGPFRNTSTVMLDALLSQRNRRFAKEITEILGRSTTAFVAIGVGHFIGNGSVLDLLAALGLHVTRME